MKLNPLYILGLIPFVFKKTVPGNVQKLMVKSKDDRISLDNYIRLAKDNQYDIYVKQLCRFFKMNTDVIHAIIYQESRGIPNAIGSIGERGLMQITKIALLDFNDTYKESTGFSELFNAFLNIEVGTGYLALLKNRWGNDLWKAVTAYNGGKPDNQYSQTHYTPKIQQWTYYFRQKGL